MEIELTIKRLDEGTFAIVDDGKKIIYSTDGKDAATWVRSDLQGIPLYDAPQISSYVTVKQEGRGKIAKGAIGYATFGANAVYNNSTCIFITSSCASTGANKGGMSIIKDNLFKVVALFASRRMVMPDWINCKDEYLRPTDEVLASAEYQQWNNDALIYSLFNNSSQQSSLRDVQYKGKTWQIRNQFFFLSNEEMKQLADKHGFNEMYQDAKTYAEDSYVYNLLQSIILSENAKQVLEAAKALLKKAMTLRGTYHQDHPEYHLNSWDAGWAQMKPMFKEHFKEDYQAFVVLYKKFEDRMREGVYKFGFLK